MLSPYRVLDLTDVRGQLAGMILGDLGADVIRVEPPEGSAARGVGPLETGGEESERSLSFAAFNRNKRSIVLDLAADGGRARFLELVATADFVLDSGPPSLLDSLGLEPARLREVNGELVQVRITPFGSDGPRADWPAADLTLAALAGPMSVQGDRDRAPVRLSVPQAWRHAGAEAAIAALVGHARVRTTGRGVFVDVSAQCALSWTMLNAMTAAPIQGFDYQRDGSVLQIGPRWLPLVHPAKDGHVVALGLGALTQKLIPWLEKEGIVDRAWIERETWKSYDYRIFRGGEFAIPLEELTETLNRFFARKTKHELFLPGLEIGATIAPVARIDDLLDFDQLADRNYFRELDLPSGSRARVPGPFARLSKTPVEIRRRAPRLGEHTDEILSELARAKDAARRPQVADHAGASAGDDPKLDERIATPADSQHAGLPFAGLKVADFSWVGVGPISGKYLADHGANVIRIESSTRADNLRTAGPYKDDESGWNRSQFFGEFNTSKRSLSLDLKHERASEVARRLLGWADVVLESFTPGAADRLGIGYEDARRENPSIVMVSTCLMGQSGPCSSMAGYGYHAAAVAGFFELTGWPDRPPVGPWNAYTDTVAPRFLVATLLAALDHERRTGEGQHIDLGQMEAALHFLAPEILAHQTTPIRFDRNGNRSRDAAPQGVYPCAGEDEWLAIAVESDVQWQALRTVLGEPDWARDPSLDRVAGRIAAHDAIDRALAEWTRTRDPRAAMQSLVDGGVPAGHVQRSSDLQRDPQYHHRRFYRHFDHPEMGRIPYSGHQFRISDYDNGPRSAAPLLGGDSFDVLDRELGFEAEEIADLVACGAIS